MYCSCHSLQYSELLLHYIFIYFACFASIHIMGLEKNYFLLSDWSLLSLLYHNFYYVSFEYHIPVTICSVILLICIAFLIPSTHYKTAIYSPSIVMKHLEVFSLQIPFSELHHSTKLITAGKMKVQYKYGPLQ